MKQHAAVQTPLCQPLTHRVHLHARAKVCQLEVSKSVQQHVVRLDVAVDEAHGVNGVQGHHHFCRVELGPFLWHVIGAGEVDQVASWHVLHHHVEVVVILEGTAQLNKDKDTIDGTLHVSLTSLTERTIKQVIPFLVLSHLDYCSTVCSIYRTSGSYSHH